MAETSRWRGCTYVEAARRSRVTRKRIAINEAFAETNGVRLGHRRAGGAERASSKFSRQRRRPVARICLCGETGDTDSGRPVLRRALGRPQCGGGGLRYERRLQRSPSCRCAPGTDPKQVIDELDRLLEPYGSVGAIARRDQPSNRFLEDELNQQKVMSITIPFIFFGVAAFLLECRAWTPGDGTARTDRRIEGAGLSDNPAGASLSQAGRDHRTLAVRCWASPPATSLARR